MPDQSDLVLDYSGYLSSISFLFSWFELAYSCICPVTIYKPYIYFIISYLHIAATHSNGIHHHGQKNSAKTLKRSNWNSRCTPKSACKLLPLEIK